MRIVVLLALAVSCFFVVPASASSLSVLASAARENLVRLERDHAAAAQNLAATGLAGEGAADALLGLCARTGAVDCASVDPKGVMVLVEPPAYKSHEGAFIGDQPQVKRALTTSLPQASELFVSVEGVRALDFERPVLKDGTVVGLASILVEPAGFFGAILCGATLASGGTAAVVQPDGRILWASRPDIVGLGLFASGLAGKGKGAALRVLAEPEGEMSGVAWTTITLYDASWRLLLTPRRAP